MSNKVRVCRILVYEGDREWVEETLQKSSVPLDGIKIVLNKEGCVIKSCLIDKFPEILDKENLK